MMTDMIRELTKHLTLKEQMKIEEAYLRFATHKSFSKDDDDIASAIMYIIFINDWFKNDSPYSDYGKYYEGEDEQPTGWWVRAWSDTLKEWRTVTIFAVNHQLFGKTICVDVQGKENEVHNVKWCDTFKQTMKAVENFLTFMDE